MRSLEAIYKGTKSADEAEPRDILEKMIFNWEDSTKEVAIAIGKHLFSIPEFQQKVDEQYKNIGVNRFERFVINHLLSRKRKERTNLVVFSNAAKATINPIVEVMSDLALESDTNRIVMSPEEVTEVCIEKCDPLEFRRKSGVDEMYLSQLFGVAAVTLANSNTQLQRSFDDPNDRTLVHDYQISSIIV